NAQVVTSRSGARSARIIKRAVMAGLNASGVHIRDLEVSSVPVNRFTIQSHNDQGGVDIRTNEADAQWINIIFFNEDGMDLDLADRRKIEAIYNRNDFRRAFPGELGEIYYPARALESYVNALEECVDIEAIKEARLKIVFDFGYGAASLILTGLLGKFDCEVLSLNACTDERRMTFPRKTREESLQNLSDMVVSFNGDLGLLFDNGAERLALVDDKGTVVEGSRLLIAIVDLVTRTYEPGAIAVPVDQPYVIENIAESRGFKVIRTRSDSLNIMSTSRDENVVFSGDGCGGFIFPELVPACDAIVTISKILFMISDTGKKLSEVIDSVKPFFLNKRELFVSWDAKGTIMRELLERHQGPHVDNTDGIKIILGENRWVLIQPDQEEPMIRFSAEGTDEMDCYKILDEYEDQIKKIMTQ
ncbi:MAG: hypothetical protein JW738_00955, partial [Actinobacteria bacterium]|nr:hypothetical protein [Actinomycetota bacterium]